MNRRYLPSEIHVSDSEADFTRDADNFILLGHGFARIDTDLYSHAKAACPVEPGPLWGFNRGQERQGNEIVIKL